MLLISMAMVAFELITSCSYYSNQGTCIELYEKVHGKYEKVKSCE